MLAAVSVGDFGLVQWMLAQNPPCPLHNSCFEAAARNGDLAMLQWLCAQRLTPDQGCLYSAIQHGKLENVQWIYQQQPLEFCVAALLWPAVAEGDKNLELLQWMLLHPSARRPWDACYTFGCAVAGGLTMLQWLHGEGYQLHAFIMLVTHIYWRGCSVLIYIDQWDERTPWPVPTLMLWGDHGHLLGPSLQEQLWCAQATFCTFHGLLRWTCSRLSESSTGCPAGRESKSFCSPDSFGQQLLKHLARLPDDIISTLR